MFLRFFFYFSTIVFIFKERCQTYAKIQCKILLEDALAMMFFYGFWFVT